MKVNIRDKHGQTPLHYAAHLGKASFAELLLKHGANPNLQQHNYLTTPLHHAVVAQTVEVIQVLVAHKDTDIMIENTKKETALHMATSISSEKVSLEVMRALLSGNRVIYFQGVVSVPSPLHLAVSHHSLLEFLLEKNI